MVMEGQKAPCLFINTPLILVMVGRGENMLNVNCLIKQSSRLIQYITADRWTVSQKERYRQIDRQTDKQIDRQTDSQIDRQSDSQIDRYRQKARQTDSQVDRQPDIHIQKTDSQIDKYRQIARQPDRQIARETDIDRQPDRQIWTDRQINRQTSKHQTLLYMQKVKIYIHTQTDQNLQSISQKAVSIRYEDISTIYSYIDQHYVLYVM